MGIESSLFTNSGRALLLKETGESITPSEKMTTRIRLLSLGLFLTFIGQPSLAQLSDVESRRKVLNDLLAEQWEYTMRTNPVFASVLGDKRWNDKLTDYSVKAENVWLGREQALLLRLAAIVPDGMTDAEKTSREMLLRRFATEAAREEARLFCDELAAA